MVSVCSKFKPQQHHRFHYKNKRRLRSFFEKNVKEQKERRSFHECSPVKLYMGEVHRDSPRRRTYCSQALLPTAVKIRWLDVAKFKLHMQKTPKFVNFILFLTYAVPLLDKGLYTFSSYLLS